MTALAALIAAVALVQGPAPAAASAPKPDIAQPSSSITVRFAGREGERPIPFEVVKGVAVFKVKIGDREAKAILDNGAARSVLDQAFARAAGLEVGPPDGVAITQHGSVEKRRVSKVPLSIPGAFDVEIPAMPAIDMSAVSTVLGRKIDFIFGADFFNITVVAIDASRQMMRIGPSGGVRLPPAIPMFSLEGEPPHIEVLINGKPVSVTVDLGSNNMLLLTPEAWTRVGGGINSGMTTRNLNVIDATRSIEVQTEILPQIKIGPIVADNVTATIRPWSLSEGDGTIGFGLLQRYLVVIDADHKRMWLARPAPHP
jgi:predicted aspartyl protease